MPGPLLPASNIRVALTSPQLVSVCWEFGLVCFDPLTSLRLVSATQHKPTIVSMPQLAAEFATQYAALTAGVGLVDFSTCTQIEFTGKDRASFLHNLCTNNVRDLAVGAGCEAFVLNVKGHIVGHVFIFAGPESQVLEAVPGQAEALLAHFDRYLIREDVQLHDRSQEWSEFFLSGPNAETLLTEQSLPAPTERLAHTAAQIAGFPVWIRRVDLAGPIGFLIAFRRDAQVELERALLKAGAVHCAYEVFESARIEYGMPLFGQDISDENLPQEIDRDKLAISFTKGCYLGQETVARIDALGHVNRLLRGVKFSGDEVPPPGTELHTADGKPAGKITSGAWSPKLAAPLALAFLKRGHHEPGAKLESLARTGEVINLSI
jgi:tRNA-modifying protein YgfZ